MESHIDHIKYSDLHSKINEVATDFLLMQLYRLRQEVRDDQIPIVNSPFCLPHRRKRRSILKMERLETQLWRYRWEAMDHKEGYLTPN